ncbi:MAG: hypothetical protein IJT30_10315 [Muribaculaceae bacterium]|nr:hypothetical protein [Muribaculaceae bacterium]
MKHLTITYGKILALGLLAVLFASCEEDSVDMNFSFTCNNGLLEFVVPTVEYVDEDGKAQQIVLDEAQAWNESDETSKIWTQHLHFNSLDVTRQFTITYRPRTGVEATQETYAFARSFGCTVQVEPGHGQDYSFPIKHNVSVISKDNVNYFITQLASTPDVWFVSVDKDGNITNEEK